jgi:DNA-binding CsgD family transcriptional regulator
MNINSNQFSEREKDVAKLLLQGKGNKQIALELEISSRTVEFHLSNIYAKLDVNSRAEAILKLTESHLRESTGSVQVHSTVAHTGNLTENGFKSLLRRRPVKKLYPLIGGLLAAIIIIVVVILKLATQSAASQPISTSEINITVVPSAIPTTPASTETSLPTIQPTSIVIAPHTVNGYTAAIESYYIDTSHILFQVRITGAEITSGNQHHYLGMGIPNLYDENGNLINTSSGGGPAIDPALYQFGFVPVTLLKGDHLKGQLAFDISNAPDYNRILAQFRFDFDLPIYPEVRFYPKQTATANNLEILLDSVTVTPAFTQIYLCFPPLTYAPWTIGNQSILQIDGQEAYPMYFSELFNSETGGDMRAGSEPYWVPPIKNGRCIKSTFPIGSSNPTFLTFTIPQLENLMPYMQGDAYLQLPTLYPGLSEKQAFYKYLEEKGYTYKGPWVFTVELTP